MNLRDVLEKYVDQENPEPHLVVKDNFGFNHNLLVMAGFERNGDLWVISLDKAKEAMTKPVFNFSDWEKEYSKKKEKFYNNLVSTIGDLLRSSMGDRTTKQKRENAEQ